jgi:hypothetical protein
MLVDELANELYRCGKIADSSGPYRNSKYSGAILDEKLKRINYHLTGLTGLSGIAAGQWISSMNSRDFNSETEKKAMVFLDSLKNYFSTERRKGLVRKDAAEGLINDMEGEEGRYRLRNNYENEGLMDLALDRINTKKFIYTKEKIIQKYEPGYMKTTSRHGRSHFFAPSKMLGRREIDTYIFNLSVIWLVTIILYLALLLNLLRKFVTIFGNMRLKRSEQNYR